LLGKGLLTNADDGVVRAKGRGEIYRQQIEVPPGAIKKERNVWGGRGMTNPHAGQGGKGGVSSTKKKCRSKKCKGKDRRVKKIERPHRSLNLKPT